MTCLQNQVFSDCSRMKDLKASICYYLQKKKELSSEGYEAVSDDVVAQLHIDEKAVQLFLWADTEDRAANFNK